MQFNFIISFLVSLLFLLLRVGEIRIYRYKNYILVNFIISFIL